MKKLVSARLAGNILLVALGVVLVFHFLVLLRVIPSGIVWGGRIQGVLENLFTLETIALLVTVLFTFILAAKSDYIRAGKLSGVSFENLITAPFTILLALCALRLAIEK